MAKDPAFLFYYEKWVGGTKFRGHTPEMKKILKGCYIDLLSEQADIGYLTLEAIKEICNGLFEKVWPILKEKFSEKNGVFFNKKLKEIITKRKEFSESRRRNRLNKKKKQEKDMNNTSNSHEKDSININTNTNINKDVNNKYSYLSLYLKNKIIEQSPHAKITDAQLKNWNNDFRLMVERDKRTEKEIKYIIYRAFEDDFWKGTLRSASKLRSHLNAGKMDRLYPNRENDNTDPNGNELPAGV